MKAKLRKINVDNKDYLWNVSVDEDAANMDYILLKVWIPGKKQHPLFTVRYRYNIPWLFYGEIISANTLEQQENLKNYLQLEPLTPKKVAEIIRSSTELLEKKHSDYSLSKNFLHMDDDGELIV